MDWIHRRTRNVTGIAVCLIALGAGHARPEPVYPAAVLPFHERGSGMKDMGEKVSDILFAQLAADPGLYLVERSELEKVLQEQEISLSGMVRTDQAAQVGQLTGAKPFHRDPRASRGTGDHRSGGGDRTDLVRQRNGI